MKSKRRKTAVKVDICVYIYHDILLILNILKKERFEAVSSLPYLPFDFL